VRLTSVSLRNFVTFGPQASWIADLSDVNVIVGPNGSGKTNLLKAINYVGDSFEGSGYSAQRAVDVLHNRDFNQSVSVEVGVKLSEVEIEHALTVLLLGFEDIRSTGSPNSPVDANAANRGVRAVLRQSPQIFRPFLDGTVYFCSVSAPGHGQPVLAFLRFASQDGELCLDTQNRLTIAPFNNNSWARVDLPEEILAEFRRLHPGAFDRAESSPVISPGEIADFAKALTPQWLIQKLSQPSPTPLAAQLSQTRLAMDFPSIGPNPSAELIALTTFAVNLGYPIIDISLFKLLGKLFTSSIIHASDARAKQSFTAVSARQGMDTASGLLALKVSPESHERERYREIQEAFVSLTGIHFEAVQHTVPDAQESEANATATSHNEAAVVFSDGRLSYPAQFAAAGVCEVLETLSAVRGPSNCVILLDEPALNLHPSLQRRLYGAMTRIALESSNQLFIVTHSSTFVSPRDLTRAIRFTLENGVTHVHRIALTDAKEDAQMIKDVERFPRFLDALFAKGVVLLEGYQEEAGLPQWFLKCEGGSTLFNSNVLFLTVAGDGAFPRFARVLDAWGIPYRLVADGSARARVERFGDHAITYPQRDFSVLLDEFYPIETARAVKELGGSRGIKDPVVAKVVASETPPPEPIRGVWSRLRPFIDLESGDAPETKKSVD
jgi:ABC-type polar amino acid transport system ATPase subunit